MKLIEILNDVASRSGQTFTQIVVNDESVKSYLIRAFNLIYQNFNLRYHWPWREKTTSLQTVLNYTTGTVSVTNGSRTMTGSGTNWTSDMGGRYVKLTRDTEIYLVKTVQSATQIILADPYLGTTGSGFSYLIWKKFYDLPPDVPYSSDIFVWQWPQRMNPIPFKEIGDQFSHAYLTAFPRAWSWYGINRSVSTYNTGTISFPLDSKTLTGIGTSFIGNVFEGSKIINAADTYHIETVDSDLQITTVQNCNTAISGAATNIQTKNRSQICFDSTPDPAVNLYVTYFKKVYPLKNDNDEPEIMDGYEIVLGNILYAYILDKLNRQNSVQWLQIADGQAEKVYQSILGNVPIDQAIVFRNTFPAGYRPSLYG